MSNYTRWITLYKKGLGRGSFVRIVMYKSNVNMKKLLITTLLGLSVCIAGAAEKQRQLLIFVGEGNMFGVRPEKAVVPILKKEKSLRGDEFKVAWAVENYLPVSSLDKDWKPADPKAKKMKRAGNLYKRMFERVKRAAGKKEYETIVLYWYQGASDARNEHGAEYAESVERVIKRLEDDLKLGTINVVLTGLTDSKKEARRYKDWDVIRQAQQKLAKKNKKWTFVSTDELNGPANKLKLTNPGFKQLGKDYAESALTFIPKDK